jgi:DNA topoisomerase-3
VPTTLGLALVSTYEQMGLNLHKPSLRAQMESDMSAIAQGSKSKEQVLKESLSNWLDLFKQTESNT